MVQILPKNDSFGVGSPSMGQFVCLYLGARLSTGTVWPWTPQQAFQARPLHGAYQSTNSLGIPDYNAAFYSNGAAADARPSGVMFREERAADVKVTGLFEMRSLVGAAGLAQLGARGVFSRYSVGTLVGDGTADVRYENGSCYAALIYRKDSDGSLRFAIYRVNTGATSTFTLLGTESANLNVAGITDYSKLVTVTLDVSGVGATVSITATVVGFGSTIVITRTASDASASRLTNAGRVGLVMASERAIAGVTCVDLCHMLATDEAGVRTVQDEFKRLSLAGAKQIPADTTGRTGGYLSSAFYWDAATFDGTDNEGGINYTGSKRLLHSGSTAVFDHQITDDNGPTGRVAPGRMILAQRPADSRFSQHRTVKITMPGAAIPTASTGEVWAGLVLRANQAKPRDQVDGVPQQAITSNANVPGGTGYLLVLRAKTSTQVIWQMQRLSNGTNVPLARVTENSPFTVFPGYGVQFTLELDVRPKLASDPFGVVEIVCKVNGALLNLGTPLVGGILNPSTGIYHDSAGGRIQSNLGEGLFVCNGLTSTGADVNNYDPIFDDWTQEALTNATLLDQDQLTVVTLPEGAATGTALDTIVGTDWPFEIEYQTHHVSTPFESGHRQTMPRFVNDADAVVKRILYSFSKRGMKPAELASLRTHYDAHNGLELPFNFTASGEALLKVHYVEDSLEYARMDVGGEVYEVAFQLEEIK